MANKKTKDVLFSLENRTSLRCRAAVFCGAVGLRRGGLQELPNPLHTGIERGLLIPDHQCGGQRQTQRSDLGGVLLRVLFLIGDARRLQQWLYDTAVRAGGGDVQRTRGAAAAAGQTGAAGRAAPPT